MYYVGKYLLLFVVVVLLQVLLFSHLNLSLYVNPLVYVVFLLLLPMETHAVLLLILALLTGAVLDLLMGTAGLNTIASLATAFFRPFILRLIVGKETLHDGGIPGSAQIGVAKYTRYSLIIILLHCVIFCSFESFPGPYYYLTLLRILLSTLVTAFFVYWIQLIFAGKRKSVRKTHRSF